MTGPAHAGGFCGVGGTAVGADCRAHSKITGNGGEGAAHKEADGRSPAARSKADHNEEDGDEDDEDAVFRRHKCPGAFCNGVRNLTHPVVARILLNHMKAQKNSE